MGISPQKSRKKKRKWLKDLKTDASQELNIAQNTFKSNLCSFTWWKKACTLVGAALNAYTTTHTEAND